MGRKRVHHIDFYFDDFLAGVTHLAPEERGVYITLCALFWSRDGALTDNDQVNARICNTSTRAYRRIKQQLIDDGKIGIVDGKIVQRRADDELRAARSRMSQASEIGAMGGRAKAENENARKSGEKSAEKLAFSEPNLFEISKQNNDGPLPIYQPPVSKEDANASSVGSASPSLTGAMEKDRDFAEFWALATPQMRSRGKSKAKVWPEWREAKRKRTPAEIIGALKRYLANDPDVKRTGGPGLHLWLRDGKWEHWLHQQAVAENPATPRFPGPDRVRLAVEQAWPDASKYLGFCRWSDVPPTLIAPTETYARRIADNAGEALRRLGVSLQTQRSVA